MVTWQVEDMQRRVSDGMVIQVSWRVTEQDGDTVAWICDNTTFDTPGDPFVPYESLTQDQVLTWVQATDHAQAVAAEVHAQVLAAQNPTVLNGMPW